MYNIVPNVSVTIIIWNTARVPLCYFVLYLQKNQVKDRHNLHVSYLTTCLNVLKSMVCVYTPLCNIFSLLYIAAML